MYFPLLPAPQKQLDGAIVKVSSLQLYFVPSGLLRPFRFTWSYTRVPAARRFLDEILTGLKPLFGGNGARIDQPSPSFTVSTSAPDNTGLRYVWMCHLAGLIKA